MRLEVMCLQLAELIMEITDPKITKWRKEQLEINARAKARQYIRNLENR